MKLAGAFLLLIAGLAGQTQTSSQTLAQTLAAMHDSKASSTALSAQLIAEMTRLAPAERKPPRGVLAEFATEFTGALIGKDLTTLQRATLERTITQMLQGAGTSQKPAGELRGVLQAAGVSGARVQRVVTGFLAIGEEVRGPDDLRILPVRAK